MVPWRALNGRHVTTAQCAKRMERNIRCMAEEEMRESAERAFQAYGRPLETVTYFKYLGWVLAAADDDWPAVVGNLWKARKSWARLMSIMGRKGAIPGVSGMFSRW